MRLSIDKDFCYEIRRLEELRKIFLRKFSFIQNLRYLRKFGAIRYYSFFTSVLVSCFIKYEDVIEANGMITRLVA